MLRELARKFSNSGKRVCVVDERSEIAAVSAGRAQNDMGPCCDVLDCFPKALGVQYAIRNLAPDLVVCDEVGTRDEVEQLVLSLNSGVPLLISCHAATVNELMSRPQMMTLLDSGAIEKVIVLDTGANIGKIKSVIKVGQFEHEDHGDPSHHQLDVGYRCAFGSKSKAETAAVATGHRSDSIYTNTDTI